MKKRLLYPLVASFFITSCSTSNVGRHPSADLGSKKIQIIALTDFHGALEPQSPPKAPLQWGGAAILSTYVHLIQSESQIPTVILDAGDQYQGTLVSNSARGEPVVNFYNYLHVDAVAVGNHDFDYGPGGKIPVPTQPGEDPLGVLKARRKQANYPFLAANIRVKSNPSAVIDWAVPSVMLTPKGSNLKIGVVGVATYLTPATTMSENVKDLQFIDVSKQPEIVTNEVRKLRADGADYVVMVIHSGGGCTDNSADHRDDLATCKVSPELDRILGALPAGALDFVVAGHTHQPMAKMIHGIPVIQPVANSTYVGWVILDKTQTNPLVKMELIPTCQTTVTDGALTGCDPHIVGQIKTAAEPATFLGHKVTPDPKVNALLKDDFARVQKIQAEQIGVKSTGDFPRDYRGESALGNMLADTMLANSPDVDAFVLNNGGLRADIHSGALTYGDVFRVVPFDNRLALITLTGDQLTKLADHGVSGQGGAYSWSKNISLTAGKCKLNSLTINGKPPQKDAIYKVLTADFLATGPFVTALVSDPAAKGLGTGVKMLNDRQLFRDEWIDALKAWKKDLDPTQFFGANHLRQTISAACDKDE